MQSDNAAQPASSLPQASIIVETGKKTDTSQPLTLAERRRNLVRDVQASKDKLFLIKQLRPGYKLAAWHLVQVDEGKTSWRRAKDEGILREELRRFQEEENQGMHVLARDTRV